MQKILGTISAIISIFAFVTGIDSLPELFTGTDVISVDDFITSITLSGGGDGFILSALKTIAIYFVVLFAAAISPIAFILDLVMVLFGETFPVLSYIWGYVWEELVMYWFWSSANPWGVFIATVGISIYFFVSDSHQQFVRKLFKY